MHKNVHQSDLSTPFEISQPLILFRLILHPPFVQQDTLSPTMPGPDSSPGVISCIARDVHTPGRRVPRRGERSEFTCQGGSVREREGHI